MPTGFLEKKLAKKGLKQNMTIGFYTFESSRYRISAQTKNFVFLDQINPKRIFPI